VFARALSRHSTDFLLRLPMHCIRQSFLISGWSTRFRLRLRARRIEKHNKAQHFGDLAMKSGEICGLTTMLQ
jgi:hypothetical protein